MENHGQPEPHQVVPEQYSGIGNNLVSMHLKKQWHEEGFVCIPGVVSRSEIDAHNELVSAARLILDDCRDAHGFGDRIGQLHQVYPDLMNISAKSEILDFLSWAFGESPVLFGSLQFEKGTEQSPHIDAIFFWPEPAYSMAGVWVALEDIDPDAGPLFYIPGSHKWPFYHSDDVVARRPNLKARWESPENAENLDNLVSEIGNAWTEDFISMERDRAAKRISPEIKAGDVVIWHSLLAHGGAPRVNPALSRRSVVYHYFGRTARLYTFSQFMLNGREDIKNLQPTEMPRRVHNGLEFMQFPHFATYSEGVERVRSVEEFNHDQ
ncbi:phytanoyl-CoA dioxygenase family protein [Sphingobium sp. SJ10-10]|uniref:phytanoyl-CoA dioxygenase family protein n=1 Tax=Sphingobium sp. SJ10-10 TaxID=3114999 RepID=UPI002E19D9DC|nr:phytanoyl-CoA dioxygenase family protein [Sphingobium sp. SJ10-10]